MERAVEVTCPVCYERQNLASSAIGSKLQCNVCGTSYVAGAFDPVKIHESTILEVRFGWADERTSLRLVESLELIESPSAVDALIDILNGRAKPQIQFKVIEALGKIADGRAVTALARKYPSSRIGLEKILERAASTVTIDDLKTLASLNDSETAYVLDNGPCTHFDDFSRIRDLAAAELARRDPISIQCPQCGMRLAVPPEARGKKARCKSCGNIFVVVRQQSA